MSLNELTTILKLASDEGLELANILYAFFIIQILIITVPLVISYFSNKKIILSEVMKTVDKKFDKIRSNNQSEHIKIFDLIDVVSINSKKMMTYFNIEFTNKDAINKMHNIQNYYINKLNIESVRNFAEFKSAKFISVISNIIHHCDVGIDCIDYITNILNSGFETVEREMYERFEEMDVKVFMQRHTDNYLLYIDDVENLLSTYDNHHQERFLQVSTDFMILFLKEFQKFDID